MTGDVKRHNTRIKNLSEFEENANYRVGYENYENTDIIEVKDPEDPFAKVVWDTSERLAKMIIGKDIRYDGAYRKLRKYCLEEYGNPNIPLDIHTREKRLRQSVSGDDEDAAFDELGYYFLDYICRKLDDELQSNSESRNTLYSLDDETLIPLPVTEPEIIDEPVIGVTEEYLKSKVIYLEPLPEGNGYYCEECGKPLTGKARRFCSQECDNKWRRVNEILTKECEICGKEFKTARVNNAKACSHDCRVELVKRSKLKNEFARFMEAKNKRKGRNKNV